MEFWSKQRDRRLQSLLAKGLRPKQVAELMGTTKNAVIARSHRIRGHRFPSDIRRAAEEKRRNAGLLSVRLKRENKALAALRRSMKGGVSRDAAIVVARNHGARLKAIGDVLGITRERVRQIEMAACKSQRESDRRKNVRSVDSRSLGEIAAA